MKAKSQRQYRVGEVLRHALSAILARGEVEDDALRGVSVTVTEVSASPDLKNARAFVVPLGGMNLGEQKEADVVAALNRHAGFIRGELARQVNQMRYVPRLSFALDTSFDTGDQIDRLLDSDRVRRDTQEG